MDRFETLVIDGAPPEQAQALATAAKAGAPGAVGELAALWLHAAAAAPGRLAGIYDASAKGWLGRAPNGPAIAASGETAPVPAAFLQGFRAIVEETSAAPDPAGITQRTAALGGLLAPEMGPLTAETAWSYPGVHEAAADGYPERFTLEALAQAPAGSLGAAFHSLIVDNGFDLEVLDRDALGLAHLPAPLDYLNARILQCHDLWHLAAGYRTTGLHEIAISGFQAGQFGHHYSALFLAMTLSKMAARPEATGLILDTILSGWVHGRESPPLLGVDWPAVWDLPLEAVRSQLGLSAYASPWPADLFEQMRAA